jgi:hypothetical protein
MSPTSIFSRENVKIGSTYFCWNGVNAPAAFGGPSSLQTWARNPEAIEPPETLDIRAARDRSPSSFRRNSAPAWNSMARNPPPESAMPMPGSSEWPSQLKPLACSVTPLGELGRGWLMTVFSDGRGTKGASATDPGLSRTFQFVPKTVSHLCTLWVTRRNLEPKLPAASHSTITT